MAMLNNQMVYYTICLSIVIVSADVHHQIAILGYLPFLVNTKHNLPLIWFLMISECLC